MNDQKMKRLLDRSKQAAKIFPYLLPAIVLSLSLASSLLVAGNGQNNINGIHFMGTGSPTPTPSPSASPSPQSHLQAVINEVDGVQKRGTDKMNYGLSQVVTEHAPTIAGDPAPYPLSATSGVPTGVILPLSDPESDPFTASLTRSTTLAGSAVSLSGTYQTGIMFNYQSLPTFHGVENISVYLVDSAGLPHKVVVQVTVP